MNACAQDHYEILGLPRAAAASEIKRAYLTLIRENTPESAPDRFRQISEAYRVLSNAEKRAEYDKAEQLPSGVQEQVDRIMARVESDPQRALDMARTLQGCHPELRVVRLTLGIALLRTKRPRDAAREFQELLQLEPDNASYAKWLGQAHIDAGNEGAGVRYIRQAITLDRSDRDAYITLSRHHMGLSQEEEALRILDRGIHADDTVDVCDLPLFLEKCLVLAKLRRWKEMEVVVRTVVDIVPENDPDARSYAAWQFNQMAQLFDECQQPHLTKFALDASLKLDPNQSEIEQASQSIDDSARFHRQLEDFFNDSVPDDWAKAFVYCVTQEEDDEKRNNMFLNVAQHVTVDPGAARQHWEFLKRRYPFLMGACGDAWRNLLKASRQVAQQPHAGAGADASAGWVGFFVIGVIVILFRACS